MNKDLSPLAHTSLSPAIYYYSDWLPLMREAMARSIRYAPELVYLLEQRRHFSGPLEEIHAALRLYLSIAVGRNVETPEDGTGISYWNARRTVEDAAWKVLRANVFDVPMRADRSLEGPNAEFYRSLLRSSLGHFLHEDLADREVLQYIFAIFDPSAKTNASWWIHGKGKDDDEKKAAMFFSWLLLNIWDRGFWRNPELTTWARRQTLPWLLKYKLDLRIIVKVLRVERWMRFILRGHIRRLKIQKRLRPHRSLRTTRAAISARHARRHRKVKKRTLRFTPRPKKVPARQNTRRRWRRR